MGCKTAPYGDDCYENCNYRYFCNTHRSVVPKIGKAHFILKHIQYNDGQLIDQGKPGRPLSEGQGVMTLKETDFMVESIFRIFVKT